MLGPLLLAIIEFSWEAVLQDSGIPLAIMGILVVFMALTLVATFISILPWLLKTARLVEEETGAARISPLPEGPKEEELPEELVVVITAAVAATMDKPHRVVRIRGVLPKDFAWSLEGRQQQHRSHGFSQRARR